MKKWLGITTVLAFCSIIYELLLATSLSMLTGSYIWWHSWTIAFYIAGLSWGSYQGGKSKNSLLNIELLLAGLGMGSLFLIYGFHWLFYILDVGNLQTDPISYPFKHEYIKYGFFFVTQAITVAIGYLSGFEIPLIVKKIKEETGQDEENKVIGFNYFGTLIGTLVFSLIFYKHLELITIGVVVGLLNLSTCIFLLNKQISKRLIVGSLVVFGAGLLVVQDNFINNYLKTRYYFAQYLIEDREGDFFDFFSKRNSLKTIKQEKSLYQKIDFVQALNPESKELKMFLDNNFQFSTETEKFYHESFAHVSVHLANHTPKKVLVLGAGDGMLIRELLKYDSIESITHIELDDKILDMFKSEPLNKLNNNALNHPKVKSQVGDGFYFVRNTNEKFDTVFIDFPYPKTYDLSRLYSLEFYKNIKRVLNKQAIAVIDVPLSYQAEHLIKVNPEQTEAIVDPEIMKGNDIVLSTIFYAGFENFFPFKIQGESFVVMSSHPIVPEYEISEKLSIVAPHIQENDLKDLSKQKYPYNIDRANINSIFYPKIIQDWTLAPIY